MDKKASAIEAGAFFYNKGETMLRIFEAGSDVLKGIYYRNYYGLIKQANTDMYNRQNVPYFQFLGDTIYDLIFVGDMIRVVSKDNIEEKGLLIEIETQEELEYYLKEEDYIVVEVWTSMTSLVYTNFILQWRKGEIVHE